jgi:hypothetical protein
LEELVGGVHNELKVQHSESAMVIKLRDNKNVTMISTTQMKQNIPQARRERIKSSPSVCWITTNTWAGLI